MPFSLDTPLPASLPVKEALAAYLDENGFTTGSYDEPKVTVTFWGRDFTVPNPPSRQLAVRFHDLHHIVTGYGTDPAGEFEISAWELRRGVGVFGAYVQLIIATGALSGLLLFPRRFLAAWRAGRDGPRLPVPSLELYESLLQLDVGALRERYGIPAGGLTRARSLHERAPAPVAAPVTVPVTGPATDPVPSTTMENELTDASLGR